jgi:iron(III) transport system substrate-binding protein
MKTGTAVALLALLVFGVAVAVTVARVSGQPSAPEVVVYVSVDQVHAEPLLNDFAAQTGIRVKPVYDAEAAKTTGLVQRLIAEKDRPQADVFWNGEFAQTLTLRDRGVLAEYRPPSSAGLPADSADLKGFWTGVGGRARVLLIHRDHVPQEARPKKLEDLLTSTLPGERIGMAWPFFGTSATHAAALYAVWGPERARTFFTGLKARGVRFVDGNSVVRDLVVQGELWMGLTDSDDALNALEKKAPVEMILLDQEENGLGTLRIPATVALVANDPNREEGRTLIDYLVSEHAEQLMVKGGFCQYPLRADTKALRPMRVSADDLWKQWPVAQQELREVLGR